MGWERGKMGKRKKKEAQLPEPYRLTVKTLVETSFHPQLHLNNLIP